MALSVHVQALDAHGTTLISPTSPDFDNLARPLLGRIADLALRLKPFLVIVENHSPNTIVSMSKIWRVMASDGAADRTLSHTSFPEVIVGDTLVNGHRHHRQGIRPGDRRIEARGIVIQGWGEENSYYDQFLDQLIVEKDRMLANAIELRIELDAVIFSDGTLIGPDRGSWLRTNFGTYVQVKQEWYRGILEALDAGEPVEQAFRAANTYRDDVRLHMQAGHVEDRLRSFWRKQAATEACQWTRKFNAEEVPDLLRRAIRLEPFTISRESARLSQSRNK